MKRVPTVASVAVATVVAVVALAGEPAYAGRTSGSRFQAASVTWVSAQRGWMLGTAACGQATCTTVIGTADGGRTWNRVGTLDAPVTSDEGTGVTEIRFADALHGWAFGPALWATADGGATWQPQPLDAAKPVLALAADADTAYAVVSGCDSGQALPDCRDRATLWRTSPGQGSWTPLTLRLPVANEAVLAVHGLAAYLGVPTFASTDPDVIEATVDGVHWASRPDPCATADGEHLSGVATVTDTQLALLCQADIGFGQAEKRVFRSADAAQTTTPAGSLPLYGIVSELTAAADGTLLVSSSSIGSWIYRNAGGETWTTSEDLGDGGIGWNDIAFTTDQVGYVVHGPAFCCGGHGPGELWKTGDGGLTWRQTQVTPQP
jgi:hypothetical protein